MSNTANVDKYTRSAPSVNKRKIKDVKLKFLVQNNNKAAKLAEQALKKAEILLAASPGSLQPSVDNGIDATFRYTQDAIRKHVDYRAQQLQWNLDLEQVKWGSYDGGLSITPNGRHVLFASRKGHVCTFDQIDKRPGQEAYLKDNSSNTGSSQELIRDATWLHNELFYAVAQRDYVYIYDHSGMELHCLKQHLESNRLEFLRYHFLLASVGNDGILRYQDTSTGQRVAELKTRLGQCKVMAQNPQDAIMHLGHSNGQVTLWSPNVTVPLVKMQCHKGPLNALAVDVAGRYMASSGMDGQLKLWDLRMYKQMNQFYTPTPATNLQISQKGLLAAAHGPRISVFQSVDVMASNVDAKIMPYLTHLQAGSTISRMRFTSHQDTLVYSHTKGISSILVPGSSDPNFDALEANPYQTVKQRQESEVKMLLEKIQPDMITLNIQKLNSKGVVQGAVDSGPVGQVSREHTAVVHEDKQLERQANEKFLKEKPEKYKAKGRSSSIKRYLRKQRNVIDQKKVLLQEKLAREENGPAETHEESTSLGQLARFGKRPLK